MPFALVVVWAMWWFVRPNLEYGSSVWDPFRQYQIDAVEMVRQRRVARFVTGQCNRYQSVTSMLQELKWTSLQQRRQEQRVAVFVAVIITANGNKAVTVLSSCRSCWSYDIWWYLQSVDE
jgi:hypothetical protein